MRDGRDMIRSTNPVFKAFLCRAFLSKEDCESSLGNTLFWAVFNIELMRWGLEHMKGRFTVVRIEDLVDANRSVPTLKRMWQFATGGKGDPAKLDKLPLVSLSHNFTSHHATYEGKKYAPELRKFLVENSKSDKRITDALAFFGYLHDIALLSLLAALLKSNQ